GIALTLQNMAETGKTIRRLADELPKYYIVKEKIGCAPKDTFKVTEEVKKIYGKDRVETIDGITITKNGTRISIRPSNTEPIFRIFVESNSHKKSSKLALEIKEVIAGILKKIR
ncbi:MAG: phosphoglucosamine mutase, partial [Candidatus Firestonebacteria bacterium]